jgi:DNA-binding transcriptional regulator LsrR (DeoR family)
LQPARKSGAVFNCNGQLARKTREQLKAEAISLRYDYGWDIRRIAGQLHIPKTVIHRFVSHNSNGNLSHNSTTFTHLEGDCLERLEEVQNE